MVNLKLRSSLALEESGWNFLFCFLFFLKKYLETGCWIFRFAVTSSKDNLLVILLSLVQPFLGGLWFNIPNTLQTQWPDVMRHHPFTCSQEICSLLYIPCFVDGPTIHCFLYKYTGSHSLFIINNWLYIIYILSQFIFIFVIYLICLSSLSFRFKTIL